MGIYSRLQYYLKQALNIRLNFFRVIYVWVASLCNFPFTQYFFFLSRFTAPLGLRILILYLCSITVWSAATQTRAGRPGPKFEPGTGDLEARTLTTRPPHLLRWIVKKPQRFTFSSVPTQLLPVWCRCTRSAYTGRAASSRACTCAGSDDPTCQMLPGSSVDRGTFPRHFCAPWQYGRDTRYRAGPWSPADRCGSSVTFSATWSGRGA